jgi:enoyl-CoA hydratase/carnithine racemase
MRFKEGLMPDYEFYRVEKERAVAWVFLNRPEKKNAMNPPAWTDSIEIFEDLDQDDEIRAVVMAGEGKSIDDGLDYVATISANIVPSNDLTEALTAFMEKRKPVFTGK